MLSNSDNHESATASLGIRQSPLGERLIVPTFGPSGRHDLIQFVMEVENLDYIEAVKMLAERARIQLPEGDNEKKGLLPEKSRNFLELMLKRPVFSMSS